MSSTGVLLYVTCVLWTSRGVKSDVKLSLLHTNDMHARFKEVDRYLGPCKDPESLSCYGGFARLYSAAQRCREEAQKRGRSTLFLNAGDNFQGTPYYTMFKWSIVAKFLNALNVDALSLGNHEFDDGIKGLVPYLQNVNAPVVCCNMDWSREPALQAAGVVPSVVIDVGGTKVGVIGYLTPTISKGNTGDLTISEELSCVRSEAQKMTKEGVQIIIGLGHSGYDRDMEIAKEVADIDLVVGGHTHSFLYTGDPPDVETPVGEYPTRVVQASGKVVPVVQAFFGTKYLGHIDLDFDGHGNLQSFNGTPILLKGDMVRSSSILKMLQPYDKGITETKRIVGYTHVFLDNSNNICQTSECNLGNLITDAYVDFAVRSCWSKATTGWTSAAIGVAQAGSIRASVDAVSGGRNGSVTLEDVMTVSPFGNRIVVLRLNGSTIRQALEHAVAKLEFVGKSHVKDFLQVSGLRVKYNVNRKAGERVVDVKVLCADCLMPKFEDLNPQKEYGVVMTEYIAKGGNNYTMFTGHTPECLSNDTDYMIIARYIDSCSPLNPRIESRITFSMDDRNTTAVLVLTMFVILIIFCCIFYSNIRRKTQAVPYISVRTEDGTTVVTIPEERRKLLLISELPALHKNN